MKLEQSFDVAAPIDRVWKALVDVEHVAPCLPGAAVTGRNEDGSYSGSFTVKIGPTSASYTGRLEMDQIDEATRTARMHAVGTDKRGQGGARATILSTLTEQGPGATHVEVITDYHITGRLARFGRGGMIEDISQRLLREFAARLQDSLVGGEGSAAEPASDGASPTAGSDAEELAEAATAGAPDLTEQPPSALTAGATPGALSSGPAPPPSLGAPHEDAAPPPPTARPLAPPAPAEPVHGLSLVSGVMLDRIKRNPAPFVAMLIVLLGLMRRSRRRRRRRSPAAVLADD